MSISHDELAAVVYRTTRADERHSMWPLLRRDGLAVPYIALTLLWNRLVGHNPFRIRQSTLLDLFTAVSPCFVSTSHRYQETNAVSFHRRYTWDALLSTSSRYYSLPRNDIQTYTRSSTSSSALPSSSSLGCGASSPSSNHTGSSAPSGLARARRTILLRPTAELPVRLGPL